MSMGTCLTPTTKDASLISSWIIAPWFAYSCRKDNLNSRKPYHSKNRSYLVSKFTSWQDTLVHSNFLHMKYQIALQFKHILFPFWKLLAIQQVYLNQPRCNNEFRICYTKLKQHGCIVSIQVKTSFTNNITL